MVHQAPRLFVVGPVGGTDSEGHVVHGPCRLRLPTVAAFDSVLTLLAPVSRRFADAGHQLYLVGGIVRDGVLAEMDDSPSASDNLGAGGNDIDLTTDARPEVTKALLKNVATSLWAQGERFGTIGARVDGRDLEITTFRADVYRDDSRKPEVAFGHELRGDLARRDFTINAMAVSTATGQLHDPHHGRRDLRERLLRTPLDPHLSFSDDPLRILRAARFLPRFDMRASPELAAAASALAPRLSIVSVERIRDEWERLLAVTSPRVGLDFLDEHGVVGFIAPEVSDLPDPVRAAARERAASAASPLVRRAGFLADLDIETAHRCLADLRYSNAVIADSMAVLSAAARLAVSATNDESLRRIVATTGRHVEPVLIDEALVLARIAAQGDRAAVDHVERVTAALGLLRAREDLRAVDLPIGGDDVMREFDVAAGRAVGEALEWLREQRIVHGPLDRDQAIQLLLERDAGSGNDPGSDVD